MSITEAVNDGIRAKLARAQAAMTDPRMTGDNPHFESKFVPRDQAIDAVLPALRAEGLTLSQGIFGGNLVTKVIDDAEELVLSEWPVAANTDPQKYMSATTYASRGSLMLAFARAGDPDDDGTQAADTKRDYTRLTKLKGRWAETFEMTVEDAGRAIVGQWGNPSHMGDDQYEAMIAGVQKSLDDWKPSDPVPILTEMEEVPF